MHVQDHGKMFVEDHLHRRIEAGEVVGGNAVRLIVTEHRSWVNAEADVIETHFSDELNILNRIPGFEVFLRVALRIVDLREPLAEIDSAAKMFGAPEGERGLLRKRRTGCAERKDEGEDGAGGQGGRPRRIRFSAHSLTVTVLTSV